MRATLASVSEALGPDAASLLDYLENKLHLIVTDREERDRIRFELDPLAEYLAALDAVEEYAGDEYGWREFFSQADAKPGAPDTIRGFLLAVRDCCLSKNDELQIPAWVIAELSKRCGLDSGVRVGGSGAAGGSG